MGFDPDTGTLGVVYYARCQKLFWCAYPADLEKNDDAHTLTDNQTQLQLVGGSLALVCKATQHP